MSVCMTKMFSRRRHHHRLGSRTNERLAAELSFDLALGGSRFAQSNMDLRVLPMLSHVDADTGGRSELSTTRFNIHVSRLALTTSSPLDMQDLMHRIAGCSC